MEYMKHSITKWMQSPISEPKSAPSPEYIKSILEEERMRILSEDMRYTWSSLPSVPLLPNDK